MQRGPLLLNYYELALTDSTATNIDNACIHIICLLPSDFTGVTPDETGSTNVVVAVVLAILSWVLVVVVIVIAIAVAITIRRRKRTGKGEILDHRGL